MLLGLEIALTIAAFRKGWGILSIVPIAAAFAFGWYLGKNATSIDDIRTIALVGDILVIVILAVMASKSKNPTPAPSPIPPPYAHPPYQQ